MNEKVYKSTKWTDHLKGEKVYKTTKWTDHLTNPQSGRIILQVHKVDESPKM